MLDIVVSKDELIELFNKEDIKDSDDGWIYKDNIYINIIALHEKDPKYIYDITDAQYYHIVTIEN
jgi:hypothetical protein